MIGFCEPNNIPSILTKFVYAMELQEVMNVLESLGSEQSKKVLMKHGAREPFYGVKIADLKSKIVKKVKKNYELSLKLYNTGNSDAMYLAGLIAEPEKMTKEQLNEWIQKAYWYMISEYTVPWVASESNYGWVLALEWIGNDNENITAAGWATLSSLVAVKQDEDLDLKHLENLLNVVSQEIHESPNRVRYTMNGFVISVAGYVLPLKSKAEEVAQIIGKVKVDMGGTACKVPYAVEYIKKVEARGKIGVKRKTAVC